jgi:hypothetical protein
MDIQRAKPESMVDISEKGRSQDGSVISLNRRLYMQFLAFGAINTQSSMPMCWQNLGFKECCMKT